MLRTLLVLLALATPLAAADTIDILPPDTHECHEHDESTTDWWWHEHPWGASWGSEGTWSSSSGCSGRDDTFDGGVTSNGNEVASARVGRYYGYESSASGETSSSGSSWSDPNGTSSSSGGGWQEAWRSSYASGDGFEAGVSTMPASATYTDGCAWEGGAYESGAGHWAHHSDGQSSSGYGRYDRSTGERYAGGCGRGVDAQSGVTDASLTWGTACDEQRAGWATSEGHYADGNGWSDERYAGHDERACFDGVQAGLGEESARVGSGSRCMDSWYARTAGSPENQETYSYYFHGCDNQQGVWGPTQLGLFLEAQDSYYERCEGGACEWEEHYHRALVVEHAYTGRLTLAYLP